MPSARDVSPVPPQPVFRAAVPAVGAWVGGKAGQGLIWLGLATGAIHPGGVAVEALGFGIWGSAVALGVMGARRMASIIRYGRNVDAVSNPETYREVVTNRLLAGSKSSELSRMGFVLGFVRSGEYGNEMGYRFQPDVHHSLLRNFPPPAWFTGREFVRQPRKHLARRVRALDQMTRDLAVNTGEASSEQLQTLQQDVLALSRHLTDGSRAHKKTLAIASRVDALVNPPNVAMAELVL